MKFEGIVIITKKKSMLTVFDSVQNVGNLTFAFFLFSKVMRILQALQTSFFKQNAPHRVCFSDV